MGLKSIEDWIVGHVFIAYLRHPSRTLFTAHPSRTHVKAPQTDLHAKPDNSSGLTRDSPSERHSRTKVTFQPKTAPKKHRGHQAVSGPPKPSTSQLPSMPHSDRESRPRPVGQHRDQDVIHLDAQAMEEASEASGQIHGSTPQYRSHRGSASIGLGSQSLWIGIGSPPDRDTAPSGEPSYF